MVKPLSDALFDHPFSGTSWHGRQQCRCGTTVAVHHTLRKILQDRHAITNAIILRESGGAAHNYYRYSCAANETAGNAQPIPMTHPALHLAVLCSLGAAVDNQYSPSEITPLKIVFENWILLPLVKQGPSDGASNPNASASDDDPGIEAVRARAADALARATHSPYCSSAIADSASLL